MKKLRLVCSLCLVLVCLLAIGSHGIVLAQEGEPPQPELISAEEEGSITLTPTYPSVEDIAGGNDGTLHGGVGWVLPGRAPTATGDLLEGEVLHLQFNEGSGKTVIDWAEQGNDGKIEGNANWVDGKYNGTLHLDGNTYVTVPNREPLTRFRRC